MNQTNSFWSSLFDLSFTTFITESIVKILYVLCILGAVIFSIFLIFNAFSLSFVSGILTLIIVAPLIFLISIIYTRIMMEIIIAVFRIWENTSKLVEQGQKNIPE